MPTPTRTEVNPLVALRDELVLKAHLAGMEARTEWEELRPRLEALIGRLQAALHRSGDEAELQLHLGLMEVRDRWSRLAPRLEGFVARIRAKDGERLRQLLWDAKAAFDAATRPAP